MAIDWLKYTFDQVLSESDENETRLILAYTGDYRSIMGENPCVNCGKAVGQFERFKQKIKEMKDIKNSGFELKATYNGVQFGFGSKVILSNANLSDELAIKAIKEHKLGKDLFSKLPDNVDELVEGQKEEKSERQKELEAMNADAVKTIAIELEITPTNKKDNITAIIAKEEELSE